MGNMLEYIIAILGSIIFFILAPLDILRASRLKKRCPFSGEASCTKPRNLTCAQIGCLVWMEKVLQRKDEAINQEEE